MTAQKLYLNFVSYNQATKIPEKNACKKKEKLLTKNNKKL